MALYTQRKIDIAQGKAEFKNRIETMKQHISDYKEAMEMKKNKLKELRAEYKKLYN